MVQARSAQPKPTPVVTLISDACRKILSGRASLPSMPDVAARIHDAMTNPNWSISKVAKIINSDPGTTAYLLRVANNALYGSVTPLDDVQQAVARLGMNSTRNLLMAHALRAMFVTRSSMLNNLMRQTWRESARLAALSSIAANQVSRISPERALLGGLLQNIGVLPILHVLKNYQDQITNEKHVLGAIEKFSPQVGVVILQQWDFDKEFVEIARSRGNWYRDSGKSADLADVVLLARLHALIVAGKTDGLPRIDEVPAYAKLDLGPLREDSSFDYLHQEEEAVRNIISALGAD
jgi:HD-like signal output (HDOD) protein